MQGVFTGFATIALVIGVGALLAHLKIVDLGAQQVLSRIAFFVASPALMVITLSRADVHDVLSANLARHRRRGGRLHRALRRPGPARVAPVGG